MNRRNALKNASLILGYSLTAPAIIGILNGCKPEPKVPDWKPKFLTIDQVKMLKTFADTIIPKTDTPSASEVGVVEFIDEMTADYLEAEGQTMFRAGLEKMQTIGDTKSFDQLNESEREDHISKLEAASIEALKEQEPEENFFATLKGFIITGYMLSEKIGTEVLAYDPIPGNYDGCIPLEQNGGKNWSF